VTEDLSSFWASIREDRSRGSSELTQAVLERLDKLLAQSIREPRETLPSLVESLKTVRPEMSLLVNSGHLLERTLAKSNDAQAQNALRDRIVSLRESLRESPRRMADHLDELNTSLSHPLLFSRSGTVIDLIRHRPGLGNVSVLESRPGEEGVDLANQLADDRDVTFYYDLEAVRAFRESDVLLVGADSFRADGFFRNKTGTRLLARACEEVPVVSCFQTLKYEPGDANDSVPSVESPDELGNDQDRSHPLFEWIPPSNVDWYLTEKGAVDTVGKLRSQVEELRTLRGDS
jgi:translation initiation factor 2B subunit (eIF-2B alpha/beta/delta family)